MPQRQGTILKKCQCANQERCSHKWTLRYWADGRQRERSFGDELDGSGRPRYGSGKRLAQDAQLKIAHDKRARVFIDPKLGSVRFGDECEKWISRARRHRHDQGPVPGRPARARRPGAGGPDPRGGCPGAR